MVYQIIVGLFLVYFISGCKSPSMPSDPVPKYKIEDTVELMYQQLQVVYPQRKDPTGDKFMLWSDAYHGFLSGELIKVDINTWIAEKNLKYDQFPYNIWIDDLQVVNIGGVAKNIFARIKGTGTWTLLTAIEPNGMEAGEWTKLYLYHDKLSATPIL
jgi:hypothetical protein